jgi:hypothetical protein
VMCPLCIGDGFLTPYGPSPAGTRRPTTSWTTPTRCATSATARAGTSPDRKCPST